MLRDLKLLSLPIEYCAFMVAIMMTRYDVDDSIRVQSSVESIVSKLNSLQYGDKADFRVTRAALHQGIFLFKKVLQSLGYEVIEMHGKEKQLQDFLDLPSGEDDLATFGNFTSYPLFPPGRSEKFCSCISLPCISMTS